MSEKQFIRQITAIFLCFSLIICLSGCEGLNLSFLEDLMDRFGPQEAEEISEEELYREEPEPETEPATEPYLLPTETQPRFYEGTVMADLLNVRSGPGTTYDIAGYLYYGQYVTIFELKYAGSLLWGRVDNGWVCMDYIQIDGGDIPGYQDEIDYSILGSWYSDATYYDNEFTYTIWSFHSDGTCYFSTPVYSYDGPSNIDCLASGTGTFSFDGSILTLSLTPSYTGSVVEICGANYILPCALTVSITMDGGSMYMYKNETTDSFTKGNDQDAVNSAMANYYAGRTTP